MLEVSRNIPLSKTIKFTVDNRGKTAPTSSSGIALIATNCVSNDVLYPTYENIRYVSRETHSTWFRAHPKPGDILLTLKGSQNGAVCLVPDPVDFAIAQDMVALRADQAVIDPMFLFAALRSRAVQQQIKDLDVSGVIPHFKKSDFDKLLLPYPDRSTQTAIGELHFFICAKIDLNRRTNETLEAMARAFFKDWFVDFGPTRAQMEGRASYLAPDIWPLFPDRLDDEGTPEGWGNTKIESLLELAYGKSLPASDREKGLVPVYGSGGINGFHNQSLVDGPAIIVGRKGTVGSLYWEHRPCFPIDTVFYVKSKLPLPYCYHLLETLGLTHMNTDAAVPGLNRANVYRLVVPRAPDALINLFGENAGVLRAKMIANIEENISLIATRDLLLPRLMSGEIRAKDVEKELEAAQ